MPIEGKEKRVTEDAALVEEALMENLYHALIHTPLDESSPRTDSYVEARYLCAYNQTRGCILGQEIACGDFSVASLQERMPKLTPHSGAGLWLDPFRGIPADDVRSPLDLIYLDANHRVLAVVELFPSYRVSPSIPPAASVLALPTHSIFSSQTQTGDQIGFGLAEDVERELARRRGSISVAPEPQKEPAPVEAVAKPAEAVAEAQPQAKQPVKPKSWLQRFLNPDPPEPRKAVRAALPNLSAYFWDGGAPMAHQIRDISATGLYVVTNERWYPGTLIQMTLKKSSGESNKAEATISLMARANRWGNDGVGLSFVVRNPRKPRGIENDGIEPAQLNQFLTLIQLKC
ncbi:MAG TPA: PilZ domain-containing protein [Terracidiphilus sp.]